MALIAQLGEHCTGIAEVVGSNPAQSLKIFSGLCSSSVTAALALMTVNKQIIGNKVRFFETISGVVQALDFLTFLKFEGTKQIKYCRRFDLAIKTAIMF